jgi:hypothetical protein
MTGYSIFPLPEQLVFAPINNPLSCRVRDRQMDFATSTTMLVEGWFLKPATLKDGRIERGEG